MDEELQHLLVESLEAGATVQIGGVWYGFPSSVTVTIPKRGTFGDVLSVPSPELGRRLGLQLERVLRQALEG